MTVTSTTTFDLTEQPDPYGVAATSDGAVWVTLVHSGAVVRLGPDGRRDHHPVGRDDCRPSVLAADGATAWFTRTGDDGVTAIDRHGTMRTLELETGSGPYGICVGGDGAVWFTESSADRIGRLDRGGGISHVPLPSGCFPAALTCDPDGTVWATLNRADAVARVGSGGELTIVELSAGSAPVGITSGADAVWLVEIGAGRWPGCPATAGSPSTRYRTLLPPARHRRRP